MKEREKTKWCYPIQYNIYFQSLNLGRRMKLEQWAEEDCLFVIQYKIFILSLNMASSG